MHERAVSFQWRTFICLLFFLATGLTNSAEAKFLNGKSSFSVESNYTDSSSADLRWPVLRRPRSEVSESLTDILTFSEHDDDPVFKKAIQVVDTLVTQSTCHQAAAAQLLITCKAVGANIDSEDGKHGLLEKAKSVYAIRVAVCETGEGKAEVPSACYPLLDVPRRLDHEIDVVSSKTVAPCLEAMMVEHYYWTSYSNSRQDGNILCQATTIESSRLEALQSYQKLAELLPEFRAALGSTRSQWIDFLKQQNEGFQHISKLQQVNRDEIEAQHQVQLGSMQEIVRLAKEGLFDVSHALQRNLANTESDAIQTRKTLQDVLGDLASLQDLLRATTAKASAQNVEIAAKHAEDMTNLHELALTTTRALENIQADAVVQDFNSLLQQLMLDLEHIGINQATNLAATQQQLHLNEELSATQEANLVLGHRMRDSSASLATDLDTANVAAGRISTKLGRVNQALSRVEAASAILSSLLGIITIPCQMAGHLHLRLLAIFAMPAIILFVWKPRKYAYSLMASYVFLETLISFIADHHEMALRHLRRLGHHSRSISHSAFDYPHKNLIIASSATVLFFLCSTFAIISARSRSKPQSQPKSHPSVTSRSLRKLDDMTVAEHYYTAHKLRTGKYPRYSSSPMDRFPRAATVC